MLVFDGPISTLQTSLKIENESPQFPRSVTQAIPELTRMFSLKEKIGEGTFSKVYRAISARDHKKEYALKCIVPTMKWDRVADEIRYLRDLGGDSNVIRVETCLFGNGFCVVVMPYFRHDRFVDFIKNSTPDEVHNYVKNLFIALEKVHRAGIIHRDIKPSNFLFDRKQRRYGLVDFGLAEDEKDRRRSAAYLQSVSTQVTPKVTRPVFADLKKNLPLTSIDLSKHKKRNHETMTTSPVDTIMNRKKIKVDPEIHHQPSVIPETPPKNTKEGDKFAMKTPKLMVKPSSISNPCACYSKNQICGSCSRRHDLVAPRAGTRGFRAPEVLLKHLHQTTAIDVWSAGVIMACLLSRRYPFFSTNADDMTALAQIVTVLGSKRVCKAARELDRAITMSPRKVPAVDLKALCSQLRGDNLLEVEDSAYDLLNRLLEPNPKQRLTASEALRHPFLSK